MTTAESEALDSILGEVSVEHFFEKIWQEGCAVFRFQKSTSDDRNPHQRLVSNGWESLVAMLEESRRIDYEEEQPPLYFKEKQAISEEERVTTYNENPFSAFLGGCSIVFNHADRLCPYLASLCQDLQQSFPHAYTNTYLTPPGSQAVPAHADDRDVLVCQVVGRKEWTIYQCVPIPYPYPHEQVGKAGLPVPPAVMEGPVLLNVTLEPGDVLYMPRGFVHEAKSCEDMPSYHATIALATHDWTLAGLMTTASNQVWSRNIDYRRALPRQFGTLDFGDISSDHVQTLERQIESAIQMVRETVTAQLIHNSLEEKIQRHNQRAALVRKKCLETSPRVASVSAIVGRMAAERVTMNTTLRAGTSEEKELASTTGQTNRGLYVSVSNEHAIMSILSQLKLGATCAVGDLRKFAAQHEGLCDLTLLCFARLCVELGALAIVE
jgi:ribosomal protein L16 Arg81 hydroxylase